MHWRISTLILLTIGFSGCNSKGEKNEAAFAEIKSPHYNTLHLIEADQLIPFIEHPEVCIIDFRRKTRYDTGHIPGAHHMWRNQIENTLYPYDGIMPEKGKLEKLLGQMGIGNDHWIVIYDDVGGCNAARIWWILRSYGFTKVKILNGGSNAWNEINGPMTTDTPLVEKTDFKLPSSTSLAYHIDHPKITTMAGTATFLDTRSADEFSGKRQKKGASHGGRIPNSARIDWEEAVDFKNNLRLKPLNELQKIYGVLIDSEEQPIIPYCHSGVRSAHTTFVLTQVLGYTHVKNYDGSWTEWSYYNLPIEKDSTTTIFE